jgi:hypothetical protein
VARKYAQVLEENRRCSRVIREKCGVVESLERRIGELEA